MKTLTTILTLAATLTLTLGCDAEPELDFGDGDVALRPWGGLKLNTSILGDFDWNELDLQGKFYEHAQLDKVCIQPDPYSKNSQYSKYGGGGLDPVCFKPGVDPIWVQQGEIMAEKYGKIVGFWMAGKRIVLMSDFGQMMELFKKDEALGRADQSPFHALRPGAEDRRDGSFPGEVTGHVTNYCTNNN